MNRHHVNCMEDVQSLRVFAAVAENLSFTRAAEALYLTQSAVSHQIARLEREVGAPLLVRQGRSVSLTPVGRELLVQARRVFTALADATAAVRQSARPGVGRLRIGASAAACQHLIPAALREFRECFPEYSLSILPADSPAVLDRLVDGTLDLGVVVRGDRGGPRLAYHDLFTDELGVLVSPLHPWAKSGCVDRGQLAEQRLILFSRHSATFRIVERYLARMNAPLRDFIELGSIEAIKELVKMGLGVGVVATWVARPEIAERSLVWLPLPGGRPTRAWCIAAPGNRDLTVAEQTFVGLCQDAASGLGER
jgi:DNA-binding transcriptional LysR family regulator